MEIEKINFKLTVGAAAEIAEFCPDKDLARIGEVMQTYPDTIKNGARFIRALNRGYIMATDPMGKGGQKVISEAEILGLEPDDFMELLDKAMTCFGVEREPSVDVEPKKKEKTQENHDR